MTTMMRLWKERRCCRHHDTARPWYLLLLIILLLVVVVEAAAATEVNLETTPYKMLKVLMEERLLRAQTLLAPPDDGQQQQQQRPSLETMQTALKDLNQALQAFEATDLAELVVPQVEDKYRLVDGALALYSTTGALLEELALQQLMPTKQSTLQVSGQCFEKAVNLTVEYAHAFGPAAEHHFRALAGRSLTLQQEDCQANVHYHVLYSAAQQNVSLLPDDLRLLVVSSLGNCEPALGVDLWNQMLQYQHLAVTRADDCRTCWAYIAVAHARAAAHNLAAAQAALDDELHLMDYTPFVHAWQLPKTFNTALVVVDSTTTPTPQPYLNPNDHAPCRVLERYKHDIIQEYQTYMKAATARNLLEATHDDSSLAVGGGWDGLFLRRVSPVQDGPYGWQTDTCQQHFPVTCGALEPLPQVSGRLVLQGTGHNCGDHDNDGYPQWCLGMEGKFAGSISFYKLRPQQELRLHTGGSNQRLKCHLVVQAPPDETAWLEVAGERRIQRTGDVIAWDDSYLHRVGNDHATHERVILDVTFYHPKLVTDLHEVPRHEDEL